MSLSSSSLDPQEVSRQRLFTCFLGRFVPTDFPFPQNEP